MNRRQLLVLVQFIIFLVAADQISKRVVLEYAQQLVSFNSGIAFGLSLPNRLMMILTPLLLAALGIFAQKHFNWKNPWTIVSCGLIAGGGTGNFIDRLFFGAVVDFIDAGFWPSFNLADSFITIGTLVLLVFHAKILSK